MKYKIYILITLLFLTLSVKAEGEATIENIKVNGSACTCTGYECTVSTTASSATITYDLSDQEATVDRLSGFKIDLLSEVTTVKIVVSNTQREEKIENTYEINITKEEKQNDFSLKSLSVNGEKIEVLKEVVVYSYTSLYDAEKIVIEATCNDKNAKIIKEKEYPFDLKESSLAVDFKVQIGDQVEDYRVVVTRGVKPNTTLKSLKVEPGEINFNEKVYKYVFTVDYSINEIKVEAIPNNKDAKVEITNEPLVVGENEIKVTVTSDKNKSEYILLVTREENVDKSVANLKKIEVREYPKLDFKENVLDYVLLFSEIPTKLNIQAVSKEPLSNIEILNNEDLKNGSKVIVRNTLKESNISREYTLEIKEEKKLHDNKKIILISIIALVITMIILFILDIYSKKQEKRKYLKKIFDLRHKIEKKRKEEKEKKKIEKKKRIIEDEIEII